MSPEKHIDVPAQRERLWREGSRHLSDYWGVVRDRKWLALAAFLLVAGWIVVTTLFDDPVYESFATVRLSDQGSGESILAELGATEGRQNVTAELVVMRSLPVARLALQEAPLRVVVGERNAFRPLETALASFGLGPRPLGVAVLEHEPGAKPRAGAYELRFDADGVSFEVRPRGQGEPLARGSADPDGRAAFDLGEHRIALTFGPGARAGRALDLDLLSEEDAARRIRGGMLARESPPKTGIVALGFAAASPHEARRVADAVARAYLTQTRSRKRAELDGRIAWLTAQKARVHEDLTEAERRLDDYVRDQGVVLLSERARSIFEEQARLSGQRLEQEQALQELDARRLELAGTEDAERILLLLGSEGVDARTAALASSLVQLEIDRGALLRLQRTVDSLDVKRLDASIAETRPLLDERARARRDRVVAGLMERAGALRERLGRIDAERERQEERLRALPEEERRIAQLTRDVEANGKAFEMLARWEKEAEIARESALSSAILVEEASLPSGRTRPNPWRQGVIALLLGALAGVGVAFFLDYLDRSVRQPQQLERDVGLQLYAAIPDFRTVRRSDRKGIRRGHGGALPTLSAPSSVIAESYRTLRANLRFASLATPVRMLAITSSVEQEGKTVTTLNLAVVMAQAGSRVIVVDADMRRPQAHQVLGRSLEPGLVDVLARGADWRATVQETDVPNLHLLPAGRPPDNPGALLDSDAFRGLLRSLRESYEYVLFDVPPVLAVADAAAFFQQLDAVLLLARYGRCPTEVVEGAREQIERLGGNLVGSVLNAFDARKAARGRYGSYGYYGYYGYYARHGQAEQAPAMATVPPDEEAS